MFFGRERFREEVAADEVAHALAIRGAFAVHFHRFELRLEVRLEDLLDILADPQPAERLKVRQAV